MQFCTAVLHFSIDLSSLEKLRGGDSLEVRLSWGKVLVTVGNRDMHFMCPGCYPDLKIASQHLLQVFLPLEVTAVQAGVIPLLTHGAFDFHMKHVLQPSDYLYHGFLYLRFLKEEEVIGAVVVSVDPKASGPADLGVVGVHWDREARSYG